MTPRVGLSRAETRRNTMKRLSRWMSIGLVALVACTSSRGPQYPTSPTVSYSGQLVSTRAKACASWRLIGIPENGTECPPPEADWSSRKLFELPGSPASGRPIPGTFCVYEYKLTKPGGIPQWSNLAGFKNHRLDPDCAAVVPSGSDLSSLTAEPFHSQFLQEAGRATLLSRGMPVRLSFVDTQPTGSGAPEPKASGSPSYGYTSLHGYTLANIGRELVSLLP